MEKLLSYIKHEPLRAFAALEVTLVALAVPLGLSKDLIVGLMTGLGLFLGLPKVGVRELVTPVVASAPTTSPAPAMAGGTPAPATS